MLTLAFGFVVAGGGANVWLMAALLFSASTFFNAMQPIAHAMLADIAAPEHHGAAFGMNNLIGEIGAVLSPAVSGALRDATGGWSAAIFLDAGADRSARSCCSCSCARRARTRRRGPPDGSGGPRARDYGVVVDSVNVSVLLYAPVRSASVGADRLLERRSSTGVVGHRARSTSLTIAEALQRLRQRERAVDQVARASRRVGTVSVASPAVEITVAVVDAVYSLRDARA